MVNFSSVGQNQKGMDFIPIFAQKAVDRCHVMLPGESRSTSAICYEEQFYAYVRFFSNVEAAHQKALLMSQRGNTVVLTRVPKGLVLWVLEPDASPVKRGSRKSDREF
jgi:UDP-N-acetylmuramoylalanine-D-glutamate ligase